MNSGEDSAFPMVSLSSSASHKHEGSVSLSPDSPWKWKSSRSLGSQPVGGVHSAKWQDSSLGGGAGVICFGVVHVEEEVQVRVQVEVEREEVGDGETHGESQNEEATRDKRSTAHQGWHGDGKTRACRHLSHAVSMHRIRRVRCA